MSELLKYTIDGLCEQGIITLQTGPFGSQLHAHDYVSNGVAVVPTEAIQDRRIDHTKLPHVSLEKAAELSRHRLLPGDILFARRGAQATGQSALVRSGEEGFLCGTGAIRLRIKRNNTVVSSNYLSHVLMDKASRDWIRHNAIGATMPNLNEGIVRRFSFTAPSVSEQDTISNFLDTLDHKIDLNRRTNEMLEVLTREIFRDWFVEFGPTRAKMERRAPYLTPEIWSLFPDRLDDEGKPEGWEKGKLSDFMSFQGGTQPPANEFVDGPRGGYVRLLQIRDYYSSAHMTYIPDTYRLRKVEIDDICIGRYGSGTGDEKDSLGRLCRGLEGAINVALVKVQPVFECREWLATYIGSGDFRRAISGGSARAVQAGFRQEDLSYISVAKGPAAIYSAFELLGADVWAKAKQILSESEAIFSLRDFLLPKLMSGEARVKCAEKVVGEAT